MQYLVYILAGFGIFSLLVLLLKLILWSFNCDFDKQFIPIGESVVYTMRNSANNVNEKEAIEQMDQMLEQYTKPKVVVSRQCICPFCTRETDKIIIDDQKLDENGVKRCAKEYKILVEEECDDKTEDSSVVSENTVIEVNDIVIIENSKEEMPCNMYNNVVSELKNKFNKVQSEAQQNGVENENKDLIDVSVESTDM